MSKPEAREDFYKYEDMSNNGSVNGNLMEWTKINSFANI
jgi:hypothetical protein